MTDLQQSIFLNLSRMTKYHQRSRLITDPYAFYNRGISLYYLDRQD